MQASLLLRHLLVQLPSIGTCLLELRLQLLHLKKQLRLEKQSGEGRRQSDTVGIICWDQVGKLLVGYNQRSFLEVALMMS